MLSSSTANVSSPPPPPSLYNLLTFFEFILILCSVCICLALVHIICKWPTATTPFTMCPAWKKLAYLELIRFDRLKRRWSILNWYDDRILPAIKKRDILNKLFLFYKISHISLIAHCHTVGAASPAPLAASFSASCCLFRCLRSGWESTTIYPIFVDCVLSPFHYF